MRQSSCNDWKYGWIGEGSFAYGNDVNHLSAPIKRTRYAHADIAVRIPRLLGPLCRRMLPYTQGTLHSVHLKLVAKNWQLFSEICKGDLANDSAHTVTSLRL